MWIFVVSVLIASTGLVAWAKIVSLQAKQAHQDDQLAIQALQHQINTYRDRLSSVGLHFQGKIGVLAVEMPLDRGHYLTSDDPLIEARRASQVWAANRHYKIEGYRLALLPTQFDTSEIEAMRPLVKA
jgi:hypothetical protein